MCGGGGGSTATVEKAGPYEQKLVELSRRRLNEYKELYVPLENERMAEAHGGNSAGKIQTYRDDVVAASRLQTAQPGMAPVAGGKMAMVAGSQAGNKAAGISSAMGKQMAGDDYANRMAGMVALGRQQSGSSTATVGQAASREVSKKIASAVGDQTVKDARYDMFGTVVGAGAGWAANKYGGA